MQFNTIHNFLTHGWQIIKKAFLLLCIWLIDLPLLIGNTWHRDENGKPMPVIVQGDPNKPRAKFIPPIKSKGTKDSSNKKHEERNGRFF